MTAGWAGSLMALALAAPVAAAGRIAIDHAPLECVPYDRYTRIAATGAPSDGVAAAQLQFRSEGDGWYSVVMAEEGTEWSAFLPRPIQPLARLEYRIVMRSSDADEVATPAIPVRVGGDAKCGSPAPSSAAVAAPIVVRVPHGAPLVPPVPAGFSPAGVVAGEERVRTSGMKTLAIGAGLAGGIAAAVVAGGGEAATAVQPGLLELPAFAFSRTVPVPGSVLSLSRHGLSVFLLLTGRGRMPMTFTWSFELLGVGVEDVCVSMGGRLTLSSSLPTTVTLTAPLVPWRACGERFDVDRSRLRVFIDQWTVFVETPAPLPFHFEP